MPTPAVEIQHLEKSFEIVSQRGDEAFKSVFTHLGRQLAAPFLRRRPGSPDTFHPFRKTARLEVLKDVSLSIDPGETVALIGRNGSGKSTLLKLIAGIYTPDGGQVKSTGRMSSLIELGAGFHPEFTGRDNIFVNGRILGIPRKELVEKEQAIIDFSGLHEHIDMPVRTYSSGMYMRLAFSIAININPDILLADEVLAVGDMLFQARCREKMSAFKARGKTILLVTHAMNVVEDWCTRAVYLKDGGIAFDGHPSEAVSRYKADCEEEEDRERRTHQPQNGPTDALQEQPGNWDLGELRIDRVQGVSPAACRHARWENGRLVLHLNLPTEAGPVIRIRLKDRNAVSLLAVSETGRPDEQHVALSLDRLDVLPPGRYSLSILLDFPGSGGRECLRFLLVRPGTPAPYGFIAIHAEATSDTEKQRS